MMTYVVRTRVVPVSILQRWLSRDDIVDAWGAGGSVLSSRAAQAAAASKAQQPDPLAKTKCR